MEPLINLRRSPGPRSVTLSPPELYQMFDPVEEEPLDDTTAHSFEESFDAQRVASGLTSRAGGKKGAWTAPRPTGKGPSTSPSFPWRSSQSSTTETEWQPGLSTGQLGRDYSQPDRPDEDPDPAWFRRTQPLFGNDERHDDEQHEDPFPDRECDKAHRDDPPNGPLRGEWEKTPFPPGIDPQKSMKYQTEGGTWMFMPFGQEPPEGERPPNGSYPRSTRRRRRKNHHGPPSSEPSSYGAEEQAESEVPTLDPSVDPEAFEAAPEPPRPQPRREVREGHQGVPQAAGGGGSGGSPAGSPAGSHGGSKSNSTSWMSAMGPQKGVKFRGGAPPQPPTCGSISLEMYGPLKDMKER